jgi:hypothetical protein
MAIQVNLKLEINKPRKEVANYAFETDNEPLWVNSVIDSRLLTERPIRIGSQIRRTAIFFGKRIHQTLEIVDFKPEHKMIMISNKPYPIKVTVKFDDAGKQKTLAYIKVENDSRKFYNIAEIFLAPQLKKNVYKSLKRLKLIMEENLL